MKREIKWTAARVRIIRLWYPTLGPKALAKKMGLSWVPVYCKARSLGVKMEKRLKHSMKCLNNEVSQFVTKFTPDACYILGLLWADGHIPKITETVRGHTIQLCLKDEDFIQVLPVIMCTSKNWRIYWRHNSGRAHLTSRRLYDVLASCDFLKKSSASPTKILKKIPPRRRHYFWRGFFDGDGHIGNQPGRKHCQVIGSHGQCWSDWRAMCRGLKISNRVIRTQSPHGSCSRVVTSQKNHVARLGAFLLEGKQMGLERKHLKFRSIMAECA